MKVDLRNHSSFMEFLNANLVNRIFDAENNSPIWHLERQICLFIYTIYDVLTQQAPSSIYLCKVDCGIEMKLDLAAGLKFSNGSDLFQKDLTTIFCTTQCRQAAPTIASSGSRRAAYWSTVRWAFVIDFCLAITMCPPLFQWKKKTL